tara:strand:- start:62 stop:601 length:540 start_codon:yes stop_codon:yes gene_type:complete
MPNWIKNTITVRIENEQKLRKLVNDKGLFETLIPMPKDISQDPVSQKEKEENPKNWYTWSIDNWGCKWPDRPLDFTTGKKVFNYHFETPWNQAGLKIIERLIEEIGEFTYTYLGEAPSEEGAEYYFNKNNLGGIPLRRWIHQSNGQNIEDSETLTLNIFDEVIDRKSNDYKLYEPLNNE